jgi:hypothetical protein
VDDDPEELAGLLPAHAEGNASSTMLALTPISSRTSIISRRVKPR